MGETLSVTISGNNINYSEDYFYFLQWTNINFSQWSELSEYNGDLDSWTNITPLIDYFGGMINFISTFIDNWFFGNPDLPINSDGQMNGTGQYYLMMNQELGFVIL